MLSRVGARARRSDAGTGDPGRDGERGRPWARKQSSAPSHRPFSAPALEAFLEKAGVQIVRPGQYMDKWRLDRKGIRAVPNVAVKQALGFESGPGAR